MKQADVLVKIRAAILGAEGSDRAREETARDRLGSPPRHQLPARAAPDADALEAQFVSYLKAQGTVVIEAASAQDTPASAARALSAAGLPLKLRTGSDVRLASLDWRAAGIARLEGRASPDDAASLSHALAGVAETGTLVLDSGAGNPTSLAFLPEVHLVALAREEIVGSYEEAMARVRAIYGKGEMPRALNFISGASRTGDIGGRIVRGAHGPRSLCVILYAQGTSAA